MQSAIQNSSEAKDVMATSIRSSARGSMLHPAFWLVSMLVAASLCPSEEFLVRKNVDQKPNDKARKIVFIFSKARSANSMTSRLFDSNPDFLHFLEPFSAWRERKTIERSFTANVDFLERLVDCRLTSEEVYSVVAQGAAVPPDLKAQRIPSTVAASQLSGLCNGRNVAVKTVRQSTLAPICELQRRLSKRGDELYVIDSYRDPRAVVASLLESAPDAISSIPDARRVKKISESACQHMAARYQADARECRGLTKFSLQNEHFAKDPVREGEKLYKFIGLKMPAEVRADLKVAEVEEQEARSPRVHSPQATNHMVTAYEQPAAQKKQNPAKGSAEEEPGIARRQLTAQVAAPEVVIPGREWSDILTSAQGREVQSVCKAIMPAKLFKMVFVA